MRARSRPASLFQPLPPGTRSVRLSLDISLARFLLLADARMRTINECELTEKYCRCSDDLKGYLNIDTRRLFRRRIRARTTIRRFKTQFCLSPPPSPYIRRELSRGIKHFNADVDDPPDRMEDRKSVRLPHSGRCSFEGKTVEHSTPPTAPQEHSLSTLNSRRRKNELDLV